MNTLVLVVPSYDRFSRKVPNFYESIRWHLFQKFMAPQCGDLYDLVGG